MVFIIGVKFALFGIKWDYFGDVYYQSYEISQTNPCISHREGNRTFAWIIQ